MRRQFLISTVALVAAVSAATLLAAHRLVQQAMADEVTLAATRHELLLASALAPLVAARNLAEADDLLRAMVREGAFVYVELSDPADKLWLRAGAVPPADAAASQPTPTGARPRRGADGGYHFSGNLLLDGRAYGSYRFGVSGLSAQRAEQRLLAGLLLVGVLGLVGAALLQLPMSRWLTRRLQRLAEGTDRVAAGEYGLQVPVLGSDALGRLAGSFNHMSAALAQRVSALQASELRQRQLIEALAEGVVFQDADDRVLECNDAACRILGLSRGQLLGKDSMDPRWAAVRPDGTPFDFSQHPSVLALRTGQPVRDVLMGIDRPGAERVWVSINSQPLLGVGSVGAGPVGAEATVTSFTDVTARLDAERRLLRSHEDLELAVAARTSELAGARDAAESANRAKTEFLSRMSHELRTPLNAILGFAQVLRLRLRPAPPGVDEQLGHIEAGGWHLLELINDVLDLARIDSEAMVVSQEAVEVAPLFTECARMVEAAARAGRLEMEVLSGPPGLMITGDRTRLRQVLVNLLSNACKYNRPGGRVTLSAAEADDGRVTLAVADTGIGLTPEQLASMYQPFNRLGAETSPVPGTGIGLVIVRRLVDLMGGTLEVSSEPGVGTTFRLSAPGAARAPLPAAALREVPCPAAAAATAATHDLLYVEDNAANVRLMAELLSLRPAVRMRSAPDGAAALSALQEHVPDMVVVDISLPGMDGYELCRRLRAVPALRLRPIVALSANAMASDRALGTEAGFDHYFTKPLDVLQLLDWIDSTMKGGAP